MSRALVVVASVLLVAATVAGYAWWVLYDSDQFANRATATLQDSRVRTAIGDRVTDELIVPRRSGLLAARPLVSSVVAAVVGSDSFASLFRRSVRDAHAAVFRGDEDTVTLTLVDVGVVVAAALRALDPELASTIEQDDRVALLSNDLGDDVRLAHRLRVVAFLLAGLALAAITAALVLSRDRRRTAAQLGVAVIAAGVFIVAGLAIAEAVVLGRVGNPDVVAAAWDAFLGDLRTTGWVIAGAGAVTAAAAASLVQPIAVEEPLRAVWRLVRTDPERTSLRVVRGVVLVLGGVLTVAAPQAALVIATTLLGVYLIFKGLEVLLRLTYRPGTAVRRPRRLAVPLVAALLIAATITAFIAGGGVDEPARAVTAGCNGREALCDRRLPDVALAATHNSMSVPEPGWFAALQERPIAGQLEDGIRGLLLDTHYADRLPNGRIRTYFAADGPPRAIGQDGVSEESVEAALRLRARAGFRGEGERGMYLCHTFCELGATPLADVLDDIHEFLVTHPSDVLVIVNEDYVTPHDFVKAVGDAGLDRYAFTPPIGSWPTLREMIDRDQRLVVLAENQAGAAPWYQLAYERLVQETPFTFKSAAPLINESTLDATCAANRGPDGAPLFLLNHWVNTDPAPRPANAEIVNAFEPLLRRAETCRRIRGQLPNLLAVDFYTRGDVFAVADALNGT